MGGWPDGEMNQTDGKGVVGTGYPQAPAEGGVVYRKQTWMRLFDRNSRRFSTRFQTGARRKSSNVPGIQLGW